MFLLYTSETLTIGTEHQTLFDYKTGLQKNSSLPNSTKLENNIHFLEFHLVHNFKEDCELKIFETIASIR